MRTTTQPQTAIVPVLPKRVKTVYGLLSFIGQLALQEPTRMRMGIWLNRTPGIDPEVQEYPACGTVGCIGGWTEVLLRNYRRNTTNLLKLDGHQGSELFCPDGLMNARNQQTPAHARAVVRHIRRFQQKYRSQLQRTKLPNVRRS